MDASKDENIPTEDAMCAWLAYVMFDMAATDSNMELENTGNGWVMEQVSDN